MVRQRPRPTVGFVQVGSLIFVVIVAIWAAYLLQHWVRRREDAAATRSVEGFSKAMRVLEKRPLLPQTELRAPRPNSYAVKPAAASRATVDVKRAVPAGAVRPSSPLVARRASEHLEAVHEIDQLEIDQQHPSDAHRGEVDRMPVSHNPSTRDRAPQGRPSQPHRVSMAQRRLRAALLLLALLWVPVSTVLAITGVLLWVSVPFAFVTLVAVLYWLRTEAQADRAHRADHRSESRSEGSDRRRRDAAPAPVLSSEDTQVISHRALEEARRAAGSRRHPGRGDPRHVAHPASASAPAPANHAHEPAVAAAAPAAAYDGVFDVQAAQTGGVTVQPAAPAAAAEQVPGSWSPVPVPVPTYALKAKAEPRWTDDGIPADVFDTPEFADEAEELDDRALFARRAVSG
ncbi:hypothetical protein FHX52_2205 [Humibacillus xanthopallidus]|uniref:Uncharacterized protein n=1 Tax=Humibacillus xanthopallidus TaxID=412689 RepID=A0A543PY85_9MICO|nr:hypothetical protein FHX52_2205 [Humibacillus xanthopallidus]